MSKLSRVLPEGLVGPCFRLCNAADRLALELPESGDGPPEPKPFRRAMSRRADKARRVALGESLATWGPRGPGVRN